MVCAGGGSHKADEADIQLGQAQPEDHQGLYAHQVANAAASLLRGSQQRRRCFSYQVQPPSHHLEI